MDWVSGFQKAIDYIEEHLTEDLDYERIAAQSFSSACHFQRTFSILCGFTLGEYIRNRRLSLAGRELLETDAKVIDVALKYGYESPDSFARAFQKFHGILPSEARNNPKSLKAFSRLILKISLEGASMLEYRIEEKPQMILTGYKKRFTGTPADRAEQEKEFYVTTRASQYILKGLSGDRDSQYNIMTGFDDEGYDFYIASQLDEWQTKNLDKELGEEEAKRFEKILVPAQKYLICETPRSKYPTMLFTDLRKRMVSELLPSLGLEIADAAEISLCHWYFKPGNDMVNNSRYIELWLPIIA